MGKLVVSKSLVERVALELFQRNMKLAQLVPKLSLQDNMLLEANKLRALIYLRGVQPELVAFVLTRTIGLGDESVAVGLFLSEVIFETFRLAGRTTRPIDADKFTAALRANVRMSKCFAAFASQKSAERYLEHSGMFSQPALIYYLTDVLRVGHETCPCKLPRAEEAELFVVLKSVVDVLDKDSEVNADPS